MAELVSPSGLGFPWLLIHVKHVRLWSQGRFCYQGLRGGTDHSEICTQHRFHIISTFSFLCGFPMWLIVKKPSGKTQAVWQQNKIHTTKQTVKLMFWSLGLLTWHLKECKVGRWTSWGGIHRWGGITSEGGGTDSSPWEAAFNWAARH